MDKAPHTDVEDLAVKLDQMALASRGFGVQLHRVERGAEMLRHLSAMLDGTQRQLDVLKNELDSGEQSDV